MMSDRHLRHMGLRWDEDNPESAPASLGENAIVDSGGLALFQAVTAGLIGKPALPKRPGSGAGTGSIILLHYSRGHKPSENHQLDETRPPDFTTSRRAYFTAAFTDLQDSLADIIGFHMDHLYLMALHTPFVGRDAIGNHCVELGPDKRRYSGILEVALDRVDPRHFACWNLSSAEGRIILGKQEF